MDSSQSSRSRPACTQRASTSMRTTASKSESITSARPGYCTFRQIFSPVARILATCTWAREAAARASRSISSSANRSPRLARSTGATDSQGSGWVWSPRSCMASASTGGRKCSPINAIIWPILT